MKKVLILLAIALTANVMMAQKMDRTNAYNYNRNGQYEKAVEAIEKCVNHEGFLGMKPKDQAQAWLYRGMIYLNVQQDPQLSAKYPNALDLAYESLKNCIKADADYTSDNAQDIYQRIGAIAVKYFQAGVENFNSEVYPEAAVNFRKSYEISLSGTAPDTSALINAALAYQRASMYQDALTNVKNKAWYDKTQERINENIANNTASFAILMADVNNLKKINDHYGHERGNDFLLGACRIICTVFNHSPVFRIGGDEFVVLLENIDYRNRDKLVAKLKEEFDKSAMDESKEPWERYSAALGLAVYDQYIDTSMNDVFKRADDLMYKNKLESKMARED